MFQVRADANASVRPPGGPDTNADGSGGSELRTRLRKEIDAIALIKSFTFRWRVETTCRPVRVTVTISGDVNTYIDCASETGSTELSSIKFLEAAEINSDSSSALITVDAIDCTGETSSCSLELKI
ncbi:MAG: hypothetical protein O7A03_08040 [Alphaproteobacteria bacterium]|nr:hypothetical protein [Alphaproteobacteria bacterium]